MSSHAFGEFFLSHFVAFVSTEVFVNDFRGQLQNSHKEEELCETNDSILICISQMQDFSYSIFKLLKILSVALDLAVVIWSKSPKKVSISHHKVSVLVFLGRERLKDFLRWTKEPNLILIISSNPVSSRRFTISSDLFGVLSRQIEIEGYERENEFEVVSLWLESDTGS